MQVKVREGGTDWGWGVVVNVVKKPQAISSSMPAELASSRGNSYIVDALLHCSMSTNENGSQPKPSPPRPGEEGEMHVVSWKYLYSGILHVSWKATPLRFTHTFFLYQVPVQLPLLSALSKLRISVPSDLRPKESRHNVLLAVQQLEKRYPQGFPKLNPVKVWIVSLLWLVMLFIWAWVLKHVHSSLMDIYRTLRASVSKIYS